MEKTWEVDYDGFLLNFDPNENWYDYVQQKYRISELTSDYREILEFFQDYFRKNGIAPNTNILTHKVKKTPLHLKTVLHFRKSM